MTLVTDAQMSALRAVGEKGLSPNTQLTVMTRALVEGTGGEDDTEVWADTGTFDAWIKMNSRGPVLYDDGSGSMGAVGRYRIHFKHTTEIQEGDLLIDENNEAYVVNDSNTEETLRIYTSVIARKRD